MPDCLLTVSVLHVCETVCIMRDIFCRDSVNIILPAYSLYSEVALFILGFVLRFVSEYMTF